SKTLVARKLVQNVRRLRDWIRPIEQRTSSELRSSHEPKCSSFVAGYLAIFAGSDLRFLDRVVGSEQLRCIGEVVSGLQGNFVCLGQLRVLAKLARDPGEGIFHRPIVEPVEHAEREEVFAAIDLLA